MLRMARAEDERALLPIYTHEHVERFLTFDSVDAQRFSAIFGQLLQDGNFFVYEADGVVVGFCKATRLPGRSRHVAHLAFYQKLGFEREGAQRKACKRAAEQDYVDEIMMVKFAGALG